MKELVILSGKGGTGKTCVSASFARLLKREKILIDADVDAANLHLIIEPDHSEEFSFAGGVKAEIDLERCINCGLCKERCEYGAISDAFIVNDLNCEGCGVCYEFCPESAITLNEEISGYWFISNTNEGEMIHARLNIGGENSGLLISQLRKQGKEDAKRKNIPLILIDGPPGTGCPATSSITGADHVLIVCEPTQSGFHDMKRAKELADFLRIPVMIAINKYDLNEEISSEIEKFAKNSNAFFAGKIPYDDDFPKAIMNKMAPVEYSDGKGSRGLKEVFKKVMGNIDSKKENKASLHVMIR